MIKEGLKIRGHVLVEKYAPGVDPERGDPYEVIQCRNLALTAGINELWSLATGASANHFDNSSAQIGVGDDKATAPAAGQTDLQGTTKTYIGMDAGYPNTPASGEVKFKATFGANDGNHEWGEFTIKQSSSLKCLNRSTNSGAGWGTKTSGTTWVVTATLGIS